LRNFEVLFDSGEKPPLQDPAFERYGPLGFPSPPAGRPWIYSNFVQSLDGIVSFKGRHAAGADIAQSPEDRWLMDLLRAHADAVMLGINTLTEETRLGSRPRGPVFRIVDPELRQLRQKLGRRREMNIFVTASASLDPAQFRAFDGEHVDSVIVTTAAGAARLARRGIPAHLRVLVAGQGSLVDLPAAAALLRRELGVQYLLCKGGPTLYGHLSRAGLVDEKFLTISPLEVGQVIPPEQEPSPLELEHPPRLRPTTFSGPGFIQQDAPWWDWLSCRRVGNHQFSRYRRRSSR